MTDKLWQFYESLRDYQEPKGKRQLSLIFTKLPSKTEYPDYYDIIKEPMDMERIANKLKQSVYETVHELAADFLLMLENACKYNEPDSQIYKDALVLQQLTLQLKQSLRNDRDTVPDVGLAVQELLLTLFTSLYNHQDEAGRCYSDSLLELPEYDELPGEAKIRGISLDLVKRRLDKGVYKRLDVFQEDVFACLERARKLSRTDSDVFQDSIELQTFFIRKRDENCQDTLSSTALHYSLDKLMAEVELMRQQKLPQEEPEQDRSYFRGPWLLAPTEITPPLPTQPPLGKPFYRQELLLSTVEEISPVIAVVGRCSVLEYQDYINSRPTEFLESDVYICEASYDELKKILRKFSTPNSLRKFQHSPEVSQDEIFYFKMPIKPGKEVKNDFNESLGIMEDSLDGNPPSVSSDIATISSPAPSVSSTPLSSKKNKIAKKSLTGYILYSSEVRKG